MTATATALELDLGFADDSANGEEDWFDALVAINQRWLGSYARLNPSFGVSPSLLERSSLWMNTHFQKQRMLTSPVSKQAKALVDHHQKTVLARLRSGGSGLALQTETEGSTALVEPIAALMFAASANRCPEQQIESLLAEALELLRSRPLRMLALSAGFAGCVFRYLTLYTEVAKRILTLQLLVLLATDDATSVVHACKIASQGQLWQPNMFIYSLQKRHFDNETICDLAAKLVALFSSEMPIASPIRIGSGRQESDENSPEDAVGWSPPSSRLDPSPAKRTHTLPAIGGTPKKTGVSPHRPTTTISSLYVGNPSPYSSDVVLPLARPPPSATEQTRRSLIYSTPKEKAIASDYKRRCPTPNIVEIKREPSASEDLDWIDNSSPPKSPTSPRTDKRPIVFSEKYSWNPDCINSVSGFEWWWRSLPQHHTNLEPTQKLKMVTKAAVRLHTKGEWERAVELYLLALSMNVNDEVAFRLRVNLACAYEVGKDFSASEGAFRAALEINVDDPYARFKLGSVLQELGRFDEAAVAYEAVLEAYPQARSALEQLEEARQAKLKRDEIERTRLSTARTARSPPKPGRCLHSRGNTSLRRVSEPTFSPEVTESASPPDVCDAKAAEAPTIVEKAVPSTNPPTSPESPMESVDLASLIEDKCSEQRIDLRTTLRVIDPDLTGRIRLSTLVRLLSVLSGVDETTFEQWLPHEAIPVDANGIAQYDALLDALDECAKKKRSRDPDHVRQWLNFVETVKRQEAVFCSSAKANDLRLPLQSQSKPAECSKDNESSAGGEGPREHDLVVSDSVSPQVPSPRSSEHHTSTSPRDGMDGYHSVTVRLDTKREKARQETILRAERARVVARKHLHCVKALQDIAARARHYLMEQHEAREQGLLQAEHTATANGDHQDSSSLRDDPDGLSPDTTECTESIAHSPDEHVESLDAVATVDHDAVGESKELVSDGQILEDRRIQEHESEREQLASANPTPTVTMFGESVVQRAVAEATRRVVVAAAVAELQAVAEAFASTVQETLRRLAVHIGAGRSGTEL